MLRSLKSRFFAIASALGIFLSASAANAQAPAVQPVKPATTAAGSGYVFTFENFQILHTRPRHKDTDHATIALKVGGKVYPAQVKHMGNLNDGTYKVNLSIGPVEIPSPDTKIVLTYLVMNAGHKEDTISGQLKKGAEKLLDKEVEMIPWVGMMKHLASFGLGSIFANCDGWVAGDHVILTGKTLAEYGASHRETRNYPGHDSPTGCGSNSHYKVTWSITKK